MQTLSTEKTSDPKLRALIIEDEKKGLEYLIKILTKHCPQVEIVAQIGSIEEGLAFFETQAHTIDLAFLDIQLPDGNVFQLLDSLEDIDFHVIFTTAYNEYAVTAFRYSAIDYLLKPIIPEDLAATVHKLSARPPQNTKQQLTVFEEHYSNPNVFEKFIINGMDGMHFVNFKDIIRCQGNDNYSDFYLQDGTKIVVARTLGDYETLLKKAHFYRVHKSHLINLNYMNRYSDGYILMEDGSKIEVSRRRRKAFLARVKKLNERFV